MNKLFRYIASAFSALALVACSGTIDTNDTNNPDAGKDNVPEGVLRIFVDKTEMTADGNDVVTFTVMFGKEDVSTARTLQLVREFDGEQKYMAYGVNQFSTVTAGTYRFTAKYRYGDNYVTDNSVEIVANPFFVGEEKNYRRQYFGTLFTSTGCNSCPLAANGLKKLQEANPGEIILAAFHADMTMPDPMTISETYELQRQLGGFTGLPAFFWNMRKESYTGGAAFTESFEEEKARYTTFSGVALNTTFNAATSELDVEVGITSNIPAVFRYMVLIVEDKIPATGEYEQNGQNATYLHNNAVRDVLTSVAGDKLNDNLPFSVGVEVKATKSVTLPGDWNAENMRVIAVALTSYDGGSTWSANNVADCKVGESVSYQYVE